MTQRSISNERGVNGVTTEAQPDDNDGCEAKQMITSKDLGQKRPDYLSWDEYFMAIAFLSAQRSKDPRTQVGACIVNVENKIVGIGYNGMPIGCSDDELPWGRNSEDILETKQLYVCHAELNAVLNKNSSDVKNCRIYVALFPCNECAKVIIQSGIREVIYYSDKYSFKPEFQASKRLFNLAKVHYRIYKPSKQQIIIDFSSIEQTISTAVSHTSCTEASAGSSDSCIERNETAVTSLHRLATITLSND